MVLVLAIVAIGGSFLFGSRAIDWFPWTIWSLAILFAWGLCTLWVKRATQQRMELTELRQFADRLELVALKPPDSDKLQPGSLSDLLHLSERDCYRLPSALQEDWVRQTMQTPITPDALRSFADAVQLEVSRKALSQARSVSHWAKYPVLIGFVPVLSFLLVAPLTEWTLDRITRVSPPTNASSARKKSKAPEEKEIARKSAKKETSRTPGQQAQ